MAVGAGVGVGTGVAVGAGVGVAATTTGGRVGGVGRVEPGRGGRSETGRTDQDRQGQQEPQGGPFPPSFLRRQEPKILRAEVPASAGTTGKGKEKLPGKPGKKKPQGSNHVRRFPPVVGPPGR